MNNQNHKPSLLADPAIQLALAGLAGALVGWPLIQIAGERGMSALFVYIFAVWGGLVLVLFAVGQSLRRSWQRAKDTDEPGAKVQ